MRRLRLPRSGMPARRASLARGNARFPAAAGAGHRRGPRRAGEPAARADSVFVANPKVASFQVPRQPPAGVRPQAGRHQPLCAGARTAPLVYSANVDVSFDTRPMMAALSADFPQLSLTLSPIPDGVAVSGGARSADRRAGHRAAGRLRAARRVRRGRAGYGHLRRRRPGKAAGAAVAAAKARAPAWAWAARRSEPGTARSSTG